MVLSHPKLLYFIRLTTERTTGAGGGKDCWGEMEDEVDHQGRDKTGSKAGSSPLELIIWKPVSPPKGDKTKRWQVPFEETIATH
jgi:hypothetical protein